MKKICFSVLTVLALFALFPVTVFAAEPEGLEIPTRTYRDCDVPASIQQNMTLQSGHPDYPVMMALRYDMLTEANELLAVDLPRSMTWEDMGKAQWYKIYYVEEDIFHITNTEELMERLSQSRIAWECYIPVEDHIVKINVVRQKFVNSDSYEDGYWSVSSLGVLADKEKMRGYDAAVQAGMEASPKEVQQAVLVSNGCGDIVCLLCSDTVDTLVTVNKTQVVGDQAFLQRIALPGTPPEDGIFDCRQVAANSEPFVPEPLSPQESEEAGIGGFRSNGIVQRQGPSIQTILLWCGVGAGAAAAGVLVWRRWKKQKQS